MTTEEQQAQQAQQVVEQQEVPEQQPEQQVSKDEETNGTSATTASTSTTQNGDALNDAKQQVQQQQQPSSVPPVPSSAENSDAQPQQPEITPALATEGGREVSHKILYVGGLDKIITEDQLREIFAQHGVVESVKILFDKNKQQFNYAFVEFEDDANANIAFTALDGKQLENAIIKINWAYQSQQAKNSSDHFNVFVGDLSTEIDDDQLRKAFSKFESLVQAHVMWDMQSGRSRGYGFVSFSKQEDAEQALTMNGELIGNRAVRLNWASHKQHQNNHQNNNHNNHRGNNNGYYSNRNHHHRQHHNHLNGLSHSGIPTNGYGQYTNPTLINGAGPIAGAGATGAPAGLPINAATASFDLVLRKTPSWLTTVYLGNFAPYTTQADILPLIQNFGYIVDLKFNSEKNCAFIKYDTHERAALAIVQLNGLMINGRPLKSGWGKDRPPQGLPYQNYPIYQGR